jgi:hypothetical protein
MVTKIPAADGPRGFVYEPIARGQQNESGFLRDERFLLSLDCAVNYRNCA